MSLGYLWIRADDQVLEIAVASREEVVLATDGLVGPRDGEEEEMMERGARPMPSKEALDKFTPFGMSSAFLGGLKADNQTCRLIVRNIELLSPQILI